MSRIEPIAAGEADDEAVNRYLHEAAEGWYEDSAFYGSEVPLFHPQWALEQFWEFEMPQDLVDGYGYPQVTPEIKRMILSENLAGLMDIDLDAARDAVTDDEFARRRAEAGRPESWSTVEF